VKWTPTEDQLAQTAHIAIAAMLVFGTSYLFNCSPLWGVLVVAAWVAVKDFVFDLWVEQSTVRAELRDAVFYAVGALVALALCLAAGKFG
jgi:hypothetical protein